MFFQKTERGEISAIVYGVLGIAAILILSGGLLFFLKSFREDPPVPSPVVDVPELSDEASASRVLEEYKTNLHALKADIIRTADETEAVNFAEEKIFGMRVPKGMLDAHFQTLLFIRRYKQDSSLKNAKEKLVKFVDELLKQAGK